MSLAPRLAWAQDQSLVPAQVQVASPGRHSICGSEA